MPGTGGVRKIRWSSRGKGKRGGVRVIYYNSMPSGKIWLLTMYAKAERKQGQTLLFHGKQKSGKKMQGQELTPDVRK